MNKTGKTQALLMSLIIVLAYLILPNVGSVNAQAGSKPSVPKFAIEVVDNSYNLPAATPVYYTDPYTGEKTITTQGHEGYTVQNGTIDLTIQTQNYTSYSKDNQLYFRIAYKGHFETRWNYYPSNSGYYGNDSQYLGASADGTSKVQFGFGQFSFNSGEYSSIYVPPSFGEIPKDAQIDFKVETFIGQFNPSQYVTIDGLRTYYAYIGESSGWSNIQTVSILEGSVTSPNSTSQHSLTVPEFAVIVILSLFVVALLIVLLVKSKNRFLGRF